MSDPVGETIALAWETEQLRQARETFDQRKAQDRRWFVLRLAMGWSSAVVLPGIGVVAGWIIFHPTAFSVATVTLASGALLADAAGIFVSVWRIVLGSGPQALKPVTSRGDAPAIPNAGSSQAGEELRLDPPARAEP